MNILKTFSITTASIGLAIFSYGALALTCPTTTFLQNNINVAIPGTYSVNFDGLNWKITVAKASDKLTFKQIELKDIFDIQNKINTTTIACSYNNITAKYAQTNHRGFTGDTHAAWSQSWYHDGNKSEATGICSQSVDACSFSTEKPTKGFLHLK